MQNEKSPDHVSINRAKVDSIDLYEVTGDELKELEKGRDGSLFLNIGLFLLSASISFIIALTTTTIEGDRQFSLFAIVAISFLIGSIVLGLLWWKSRESVGDVVARIRARMSIPERDTEESNTATSKEV